MTISYDTTRKESSMQSSTLVPPSTPPSASAANRREFPRSPQRYQVRIRAMDTGAGPVTTQGTLVNVSMGGALVRVEDFIRRGTLCSVEFPGAEYRLIPHQANGRILGTSVGARGDFLLRIEFAERLKAIKEPGKM
jgi:hypothetical protein